MINKAAVLPGNRIPFLDHLRMAMIFLVVLVHAGLVYDYSLASVWIVVDPAKDWLIFKIFTIIDIFMMPVIFFISGYLTPASLKNKTVPGFLKSKFLRLMIPWAAAALILIPLYKIIYLYSRGLPQGNFLSYFHFTGQVVMNQGWLWFLPVLFLFNALYIPLSKIFRKINISVKTAVFFVFLLGILYSFIMNYFRLEGWTKTPVLDFQNERLFIYFMIFLLGALCGRKNVFESKPESKKLYIIVLSIVFIPALIYGYLHMNDLISQGFRPILGKLTDSIIISVCFNLALLGFIYVSVSTFRFFLNREYRFIGELDRNSFGVYIIHFIVTGVLALPLLSVSLPALWKWIILTVATFAVSNLLVSVYRRGIGWVRKK